MDSWLWELPPEAAGYPWRVLFCIHFFHITLCIIFNCDNIILFVVVIIVLVPKSCPTPLWSHGPELSRLLCPWDSPGKTTSVGCHFLLQGIFLTQGSNPHLLHWQLDSLPLSDQGSPKRLYFPIFFLKRAESKRGVKDQRSLMTRQKKGDSLETEKPVRKKGRTGCFYQLTYSNQGLQHLSPFLSDLFGFIEP